jgi:ABC-type branched-subunit amino acid transport system substrate-binding protein
MTGFRTVLLLLLVADAACSTEFSPQPCSADGDCGNGLVCEIRDREQTCVHAEDATLRIGQSAPQSGANQALGTNMKLGIDLAFNEQNAKGGIRGRMLDLVSRDDGYSPDLAETNSRTLLDVQVSSTQAPKCPSTAAAIADSTPVSMTALSRGPNAVLAILGNVGTPTMVRSAPIAIETSTVFFGAFTGASTLLRDTTAGAECGKYIFNVRASYAQEAQATIEYFKYRGVTNFKNMISFDQSDSFGQNGYDGLVSAYGAKYGFPAGTDQTMQIYRVRYTRNDDTSVPNQAIIAESHLADLLANQTGIVTVGIFMTDTYGAGADFIQALRKWQFAQDSQQQMPLQKSARLKLIFSNVSFVGADSLADRLAKAGLVPNGNGASFTDDVAVSQVVPNYQNDTSEVVTDYLAAIESTSAVPSFTSLEGYIAARVFIAGLQRHQGPFTSTSIVDSFEALPDLGFGVGATSGFSARNHQYSNSVWGTVLTPTGGFSNKYFWSQGLEIQFFE